MMNRQLPRTPYPHSIKSLFKAALNRQRNEIYKNELIEYIGCEDGILTRSGREAFYYILKTFLEEGDEIIIPVFSCNVLIGAISKAKVKPVFVDVDKSTLNLTIGSIKKKKTVKTKAVLLTHQFGYISDPSEIIHYCRVNKLLIIEDAAPALGAMYRSFRAGTIGSVSFFSFQFSKVVSSVKGGFIAGKKRFVQKINEKFPKERTEKPSKPIVDAIKYKIILTPVIYFALLKIWYLIYNDFSSAHFLNLEETLYNDNEIVHLSEFQAALGFEQLKQIENILSIRKKAAFELISTLRSNNEVLEILQPIKQGEDCIHTYSRFSILVKDKQTFYKYCNKHGLDLGFTFSYLLSDYYGISRKEFPNSKYIAEHILNIPIYLSDKLNKNINLILKAIS